MRSSDDDTVIHHTASKTCSMQICRRNGSRGPQASRYCTMYPQAYLTCCQGIETSRSPPLTRHASHDYRLCCCPACGTSFHGYLTSSSFLMKCFLLFLVVACSTIISRTWLFMKPRMNLGSQSSLAIPRSLQQRMSALDLQPSVAVGMPSGSKYCCSPRAMDMRLRKRVVSMSSW